MKNRHLRIIILWGTIVLGSLVVVQIYWILKAFNVEEKQFDHTVQMVLKKVGDSVSKGSQIKRLSSNFFFVNTRSTLDDAQLATKLKSEFESRALDIHYELGIYRADDDTLVYASDMFSMQKDLLPEPSGFNTYSGKKNFAVHFPQKDSYVASQLNIWIFSTAVLLFMMGFFAYAIISLLREKRFAELKTDFINNMTHELKTPVTNINIAAEILKQKYAAENGANVYLDILLKENEKLRQRIDSVLTGSRLEASNLLQVTAMDIHELIKDCVEAFELRIRERQGQLQLELNASSGYIVGDRDLLAQAITNVIDNAEKYSPHKPNIMIRTEDDGKHLEIQVIDSGIGIPVEARTKLFDKFFRVPTGNVHQVKGFGLGLSFVKAVIQKHRGQIKILTALTNGTEVKLILPKA